jgi:hypothetical protein
MAKTVIRTPEDPAIYPLRVNYLNDYALKWGINEGEVIAVLEDVNREVLHAVTAPNDGWFENYGVNLGSILAERAKICTLYYALEEEIEEEERRQRRRDELQRKRDRQEAQKKYIVGGAILCAIALFTWYRVENAVDYGQGVGGCAAFLEAANAYQSELRGMPMFLADPVYDEGVYASDVVTDALRYVDQLERSWSREASFNWSEAIYRDMTYREILTKINGCYSAVYYEVYPIVIEQPDGTRVIRENFLPPLQQSAAPKD